MPKDTEIQKSLVNLKRKYEVVEERIARIQERYDRIVAHMKNLHAQKRNLENAIEALEKTLCEQDKERDVE